MTRQDAERIVFSHYLNGAEPGEIHNATGIPKILITQILGWVPAAMEARHLQQRNHHVRSGRWPNAKLIADKQEYPVEMPCHVKQEG